MLIRPSADDGLCSFDLHLITPATFAFATGNDVKAAAQVLMAKFLGRRNPPAGGYATNLD